MTVRWDIKDRMTAKGWSNPHQLATAAGISYPVAERIVNGPDPERVDFNTLGKLAAAFGCRRNPFRLLKVVSLD